VDFVSRQGDVLRWSTDSDHYAAAIIDYQQPDLHPTPQPLLITDPIPTGALGVYRLVVADLNGRQLTVKVTQDHGGAPTAIAEGTELRTVIFLYRVIP
jgi:hypothetical protein